MAGTREVGSWSWAIKQMMIMALLLPLFLGVSTIDAAARPRPRPRPTAAQCKLQRRLLVNACNPLMYGKPPPANCCLRIRVIPLQCVCPVVNPKLAALVDINQAVRIVAGCGRRLPRHFKCGSITLP